MSKSGVLAGEIELGEVDTSAMCANMVRSRLSPTGRAEAICAA
jgi:hypothetical protein